MNKLYKFLTLAFFGVALSTNAGNGTMSLQLDESLGQDEEPALLPAEVFDIEAVFADGVLTISEMPYGLEPISFTVNMETGEVESAPDQIAYVEDYEADYTYYYYDFETKESVIVGTITNVGANSSILELEPWGEAMEFPGFGLFFNSLYYNTTAVFDFDIPGLGATAEEPVLEIEKIDYNTIESEYGAYLEFTVDVLAENLPTGSEVSVFFKGPYDGDFKEATENTDGSFSFSLGGLEAGVEYSVAVYAEAGNVTSETENYIFKLVLSGIDSIGADKENRHYNLQGVEVRNPQPGGLYIRKSGNRSEKILVK